MQWETMTQNYEALIGFNEELIESTGEGSKSALEQAESFFAAGEALGQYAQQLLSAKTAYEEFKATLEQTGDYDDSFKGLVSLFGELNGEWEKGQVGSRAFLTALELLTGQKISEKIANALDRRITV